MAFETASPEPTDVYVQRVIRTDLFLNEEQVEPFFDTGEPPTLGVAWLHDRTSPSSDNFFNVQPFFHVGGQPNVRLFIDTSIAIEAVIRLQGADQEEVKDFIRQRQEAAYLSTDKYRYPFRPPPVVQAILGQNIVLEKSPPFAEMLSSVLHNASSTTLGVLLGTAFSTDPYVMAITIPSGVLLMSTVLGISAGLQRGLAKRVESIIHPDSPKPTRPRRKKAS